MTVCCRYPWSISHLGMNTTPQHWMTMLRSAHEKRAEEMKIVRRPLEHWNNLPRIIGEPKSKKDTRKRQRMISWATGMVWCSFCSHCAAQRSVIFYTNEKEKKTRISVECDQKTDQSNASKIMVIHIRLLQLNLFYLFFDFSLSFEIKMRNKLKKEM